MPVGAKHLWGADDFPLIAKVVFRQGADVDTCDRFFDDVLQGMLPRCDISFQSEGEHQRATDCLWHLAMRQRGEMVRFYSVVSVILRNDKERRDLENHLAQVGVADLQVAMPPDRPTSMQLRKSALPYRLATLMHH